MADKKTDKKFRIRYSKRKSVTPERDVISYEDMPLDDYEQEKTEISPSAVKKIIIGVCIALAAGLIVFAFANRENLTWDNISNWWTYDVLGNAGNGYPVDIVGSKVAQGNFTVSQGHAVYASDTSFVTLNSNGSEVANLQLRHSTPVMKSNGNRFLTYGLDSKDYEIYSYDKNLYKGEAEENIFAGDIASNGVYCLLTEGNGYLSMLYVYNADNNRIYKYFFSEYYMTSVAINSDGTGCVVCGFSSDNGAAVTGVYVLDFNKQEPVSTYQIPDDTPVDCGYLGGNTAVIIGQSASYVVKGGESEYKTASYEDKVISNYCINPDTSSYTLALSRSGDGRSVVLEGFNDKGEKTYTVNTDYKADSLSVYKGIVAILDGNAAYVFNQNGDLLHAGSTGTGSQKIVLTSDKNAYVLSVNQIRYFDLSRTSTADTAVIGAKGETQ